MSRVGKKEIKIKEGVSVQIEEHSLIVRGPKGELSLRINPCFTPKIESNVLSLELKKETKKNRELHGLTRTLVANMVTGVSDGFEKKLEFNGVGYRAAVEGKDLVLHLGFSHPIKYSPREGVEIKVEKNIITVSGIDKQLVGQTAAEIREFKKPEPYKGKGIRYETEHIRRKAGKAAAKGE